MNVKDEKQFRFFILPLNWAAWSSDPDLRSEGSGAQDYVLATGWSCFTVEPIANSSSFNLNLFNLFLKFVT